MAEHPNFLKPADMDNTTAVRAARGGTNTNKVASFTALDNYGSIVRNKEVRGVDNTDVDADFM